jgi:regulator of sigma E protease
VSGVYYLASLLSLAFLIIVHEAGHFFVARWCGMRIERFSIGFGPGILKRTSKKTGTVFQIAPIPFGGFVEIRGMNIAEDIDPDDKHAYPNRPAWQRFVTIFAGPATNYLAAIVLCFGLYTCHGHNSSWAWHEVASVKDGFDAQGKLQVGDRIIATDGVPILARGEYVAPDGTHYVADALTRRVNEKKGAPLTVTVLRNGQKVDVTITPKIAFLLRSEAPVTSWTTPTYLLGIAPVESPDVLNLGLLADAKDALIYPVEQTKVIAGGLYDIVRGREEADPGGPKRIFDEFAKAWKLGGLTGIRLLMMLSVYLGMFNLLPIPALDGGRLVFLTYELVTRRRANPKIEAMVHMAGIMVLGVVMILVTLRDFHLFS